MDPTELQVITQLINSARLNGILEIQYKELRVRFSTAVQHGDSGPVQISGLSQRRSDPWSTILPIAEPSNA